MCAAWSEISFEVDQGFISEKLKKKIKAEERLPFGPTGSTDSL